MTVCVTTRAAGPLSPAPAHTVYIRLRDDKPADQVRREAGSGLVTRRAGLAFYDAIEYTGSAVISENMRRKNAILRDRIEQVLEMHPELSDGTEAIALSQDLHAEVGDPFLERTQDKLQERAKDLIEHRPELAFFFGDVLSPKADRKTISTKGCYRRACSERGAAGPA